MENRVDENQSPRSTQRQKTDNLSKSEEMIIDTYCLPKDYQRTESELVHKFETDTSDMLEVTL